MNIVITGGSKGLGKAMAEKFAAAGNDLFLCARNEQTLHETQLLLQAKFPQIQVRVKKTDLTNMQELSEFADWCLSYGPPDILIHNAGSFVRGNVHDEPEGNMENMMQVNFYSAYHLTRRLLPSMIHAGSGHIFNMCSVASLKAYQNGGSYSISKFALLGFTYNLREELKSKNIKVTAIIPGAVYTDSWKESGLDKARFMQDKDIAEMVFAASQLSPSACVEEIIIRPQLGDI
ncbi:MAG: SDR family oxidoreductase [Bacteroidetes bacterium]|nr:SDR family oxidoreductase [Bacteroidota bacterium]